MKLSFVMLIFLPLCYIHVHTQPFYQYGSIQHPRHIIFSFLHHPSFPDHSSLLMPVLQNHSPFRLTAPPNCLVYHGGFTLPYFICYVYDEPSLCFKYSSSRICIASNDLELQSVAFADNEVDYVISGGIMKCRERTFNCCFVQYAQLFMLKLEESCCVWETVTWILKAAFAVACPVLHAKLDNPCSDDYAEMELKIICKFNILHLNCFAFRFTSLSILCELRISVLGISWPKREDGNMFFFKVCKGQQPLMYCTLCTVHVSYIKI